MKPPLTPWPGHPARSFQSKSLRFPSSITARALLLLTTFLSSLTAHAADPDFLRFDNGDQLSGRFLGVTDTGDIRFSSDEMKQHAEFRTNSVRHLVLRSGKAHKPEDSLSHIGLTNGDRIPGHLTAIDDTHFTFDTKSAGTLRVPRNHVSLLAANPLGGLIHYFGPFSDEGWNILDTKHNKKPASEAKNDKTKTPWEFSGAAWYWKQKNKATESTQFALARPDGMSDHSTLRFRADWKDRIGLCIAFHADFATDIKIPEQNQQDFEQVPHRETDPIPTLFGNCYVLQIFSSYTMLYRSTYTAENGARFDRVQMNSNHVRLGEERSATVEIRCNRNSGLISLYLNNEFATQWTEPAGKNRENGYAGLGNGFGFLSQSGGSAIRISEISVSEWNGMPDSARSMEIDDKDVILMTNGTDRFAGKVLGMDGPDAIRFESRHGTILVPIAEIAEIRFARSPLAKSETQDGPLIHLSPLGRLTAKSLSGDHSLLKLQHPILGPLDLQTDPLIMIEYKPGTQIVDDWNEDL